jgi:hypothetical protein
MGALRWIVLPALAATFAAAPGTAHADPLPLTCDEDELGVSVELIFADSSPEFEEQDELRECNQAPIGTWNSIVFADETDDSSVQVRGEARSEDGFVLTVENALDLDVDDGTFDFALVTLAVAAEARFRAPPGDDPIEAEVVVEILREGDLEDTELSLAVVGEDVDLTEDLDDEDVGELRFPVELEPDEEYRAVLVVGSALTDTGAGSQALRLRVDTVVPEAAAPLLLLAGGSVLALAGRRPRRSGPSQARRSRSAVSAWRREAPKARGSSARAT